jgi:hypothetical protein
MPLVNPSQERVDQALVVITETYPTEASDVRTYLRSIRADLAEAQDGDPTSALLRRMVEVIERLGGEVRGTVEIEPELRDLLRSFKEQEDQKLEIRRRELDLREREIDARREVRTEWAKRLAVGVAGLISGLLPFLATLFQQ